MPRSNGRNHNHERDPVAQDLSVLWGVKPETAHQRLYGRYRVNLLTADAVTTFRRHELYDRLTHFLEPIDAARSILNIPGLTHSLAMTAQLADQDEDRREWAYLASPNRETAAAWARTIEQQKAAYETVRAAIREQWGV